MTREEILAAIPHRDPFLLVDEIIERTPSRVVGVKTFTGQEWFFAGHFPGFPLVPGVLLCEAALQCGAILLSPFPRPGERPGANQEGPGAKRASPLPLGEGPGVRACGAASSPRVPAAATIPVVTRMNDVRFKRMVRPGDKIVMEVELIERLADALFMKAKITVDGKLAARFEFACAAAATASESP